MGTKKKYKEEEIILKLREADVELRQVTSGANGERPRPRGETIAESISSSCPGCPTIFPNAE